MSGAIIIRRCASTEEAAIVCALLNDSGIPATLANWYHASVDWSAVQALNGIGVLVPSGQQETARQLIIDQATHAEERLSAEFPGLEPAPPYNRVRQYILLVFYSGVYVVPLILLILLAAISSVTLSGDADMSTVLSYVDWTGFLVFSGAAMAASAYFLVPLSIFVFLGRRFLNERARQLQTP